MQWVAVTGSWDSLHSDSQPPVWDDAPSEGHLPVAVATRLAAVLTRHTGTPEDCLFGRWVGFGFDTAAVERLPHLLLRGGHDVVLVVARSPTRSATSPPSPTSRAPTCGGRPTRPGAWSPTST